LQKYKKERKKRRRTNVRVESSAEGRRKEDLIVEVKENGTVLRG